MTTSPEEGSPDPNSECRLAMLRGHARLGVPYGAMLKNSDTGVRLAYDIGADKQDAVRLMGIGSSTVEYLTLMLANPVLIDSPGLYWIAIAHTNDLQVGELYYGSYVRSYVRGLRDLLSNASVSDMETLDFAALVTLDPVETLDNQQLDVAGDLPEDLSLCNVDVGLILERIPNV